MPLLDALIPIVFFVSLAWLIERSINRKTLNRERMKMIEKNGDIKDLNDLPKRAGMNIGGTLKFGLMAIGLALGSLLGSFLEQNEVLANRDIGYVFSIALFVGIALILAHYLTKNANSK